MRRILLTMLASTAILAIFAQTQVGFTTYDLQTNNSVCRRVAANAAGQVTITYTRSHSFTEASADRGTGYNFWNGSAWSTPTFNNTNPGTFTRFDSGRTGWPNAGFLRSGREIIVSHFAGTAANFGGLQIQYRNTPGTGAWTTVSLNSPEEIDCTWPRIAISGDSILVVSAAQTGTFVNGVDGGMFLHRSFDGGTTWQPVDTIQHVNENNFTLLGGDVYAIDANDNGVVALVTGRFQTNLIKSTDFGTTWTITPIQTTTDVNGNINPSNFSGDFGETLQEQNVADDSYSVIVDDNGLVHVWYGINRLLKEDENTNDFNIFPFVNGLAYWNENLSEPKILHESRMPAENAAECEQIIFNDDNWWRLYRSHLISEPSGGYDVNGNLYVAYAGLRAANDPQNPTNLYTAGGNSALLYRDVLLLKSSDNGVTWEGPLNVSNQPTKESTYPGIPRKIYTSFVPVIWQEDTIPGQAFQVPAGHIHPYVANTIQFAAVDPSTIVAPADITCPTLDLVASNVLNVVQGCLPSEEQLAAFFDIDDVPQGPDFDMLETNFLPANLDVPGTYNVKFWAEDNAGNVSDSLDVIVVVTADTEAPIVELIGLDTLSVIIGNPYTDPGVNITDNGCQPNTTPVITDLVNNGGPYTDGTVTTYTYDVVDNAGNPATAIRYVRHITSDNLAPVITLLGGNAVTLDACSPWVDPGATAFDDIDFDLTSSIVVTGDVVDEFAPGVYNITYTATDGANNVGSATRVVTVVDQTPPTITIEDEVGGNWYIYNGSPFVGPSVSASDCADPNPSLTNNGNTVVNTSVNANYTVTYTASDFSGNTSTATTNVIVGVEPTADFTITQIGSVNVIVTNTSTDNPTFWRWDYGNGQVFLGQNPPAPTYTTAGDYEICLTVRNRFNDAPFNRPESVTCKTVSIVTSIFERNKLDANVEVFPNPSNGLVNINIADITSDKLTVSVTNIVGEQVEEKVLSNVVGNTNVSFNLANKAAGMYFVTISTGSASVTKKVVLQ